MKPTLLSVTHTASPETAGRLRPMQFNVRPGEHVSVVGPNGSGKTTLLRALAGLTREANLHICLGSHALATMSRREVAGRMAYMSQNDAPDPSFTVADYISLARIAAPVWSESHVRRAAETVGVTALLARRLGSLSGGERQKAMLARCLAQQPDILLLDEPTNHLDIAARYEILARLARLPMTIITVLHDLTLVPVFARRVLMLRQGALVADACPEAVFKSQSFRETFGLRAQHVRQDDGAHTLVFMP